MNHFFNKLLILVFIIFSTTIIIIVNDNFKVSLNNQIQEEVIIQNDIDITTATSNVVVEKEIEEPTTPFSIGTNVSPSDVPGIIPSQKEDVYNERDQSLIMYVEIDNTSGLIKENEVTEFKLIDSNGQVKSVITKENTPDPTTGSLEEKVFTVELFFENIEAGKYHLEVTVQLTTGQPYVVDLDVHEYLAPKSYVVLIFTLLIIFLILLGIGMIIYKRHWKHKIWKADLVEKNASETEMRFKIKIQLLSLTKVMDQISISISSDDKNFKEERDHKQDDMLIEHEILKMPNILLSKEHDYKQEITLPVLQHPAKVNVVALKKRVRKSAPIKIKLDDNENKKETKRSIKKANKQRAQLDHNLAIGDVGSLEMVKEFSNTSMMDITNDGKTSITKETKAHCYTIKKSVRTKYIKGGKYEVRVYYSSDSQNKMNLSTKRELSSHVTVIFEKLA